MASLPAYSSLVFLQANISFCSKRKYAMGDVWWFAYIVIFRANHFISAIYKIILVKVTAQPIAAEHKRRYPTPPYWIQPINYGYQLSKPQEIEEQAQQMLGLKTMF